ncbi:MAG TPA: prolyl oligopeptidase family serine peptidase [Tepidisphaeraceae bacterium]|nr:prolyl oligopeptidase family serine peptidase [Tepidisphaeraceae bacterium]
MPPFAFASAAPRGVPSARGATRARIILLATLVALLAATRSHAAPGVYRDHVEPHWSADETRFWYRNDLPGGAREFVLVSAERGAREPAFDHAKLAAALSKATGEKFAADHLPIDAIDFPSEPGSLVLIGSGKAWQLDRATYALRAKSEAVAAAGSLPATDRPRPSRNSSDETSVSFDNRTPGVAHIDWIDPAGEHHRYATVKPGDHWEVQTYAGHVWLVTDESGRTLGVFEAVAGRGNAIINAKPTEKSAPGGATAAKNKEHANTEPAETRPEGTRGSQSPDGKWTLLIRDDNLFLRAKDGDESALSSDGKPGDGYSLERVWWSPDSQSVAALRVEAGQEHKLYTVESSPADQLQPRLRTLDYLKPGDRIDHPRPRLFHAATHEQIAIKEELFPNPWSIENVRWAADSSRFTFVYNQRGHQILRVVAVDAASGAAEAIVDEHGDTFIDYSGKFFCHFVGDDELIWMSERDGWNHLWLYDAKAGRIKNQITKGEWVVRGIDRVDEDKRQIWFHAGGVRPGEDPYYTHFCRVNFDGTGFVVLTEGDGTHAMQWSPGRKFFIDTWSRVNQPPVNELRRGDDGNLLCKLEEADATEALSARGGRWPEPFAAKGRDGATDIHGFILLPRDFDPKKKYPVVENIYAGPHGFFTPKSFHARYGHQQQIADRGMIVVQCDGMGTSGRSKKFHDVCWKNLRDAGFPDRIAWIKAAAAKYPQMDLSRVGIYGGSAGGQNAMAALLWHNDFYKVAVADCGCHDNRLDKIWWNEQWMGWPVGDEYATNSNAVNANLLNGKLMLIVGELDDNVDPSSTMQVVNALEKSDKDFELVIVTGAHHGAAETPYGSRRRLDFLVRNLVKSGE